MANWFTKQFAKNPPRKPVIGTSYKTKGLVDAGSVKPPKLNAETGSSQFPQIPDIVPELATAFARARAYAQMMNDTSCDVSIRAAKTPILGSEFFVEPYSENPMDFEISEFIDECLFGGMTSPFLNSLEDILHMFEDGYSVVEKVIEEREWAPRRFAANTRVFAMLKKLGPRPSSTITGIDYDNNGGPEQVKQNAIQKDRSVKEVKIPIDKAVIFTFGRKGGDLTGKSLLRTAHEPWYYKKRLYKIDAIQKERMSLGIPRGTLLPGWTEQDRVILRQLLRNLRTNEESFVIQTQNMEIDFIEFKGDLPNPLESAVHHNAMIMLNVLGQFISLGVEGGGGRATAGTQADLFMKSLRYVANQIAEQINMYVIPELVVWNYPTRNFPKLRVRNIGETRDLQMLASALGNLFAQDAVTWTPETENWIRKIFDMPTVPVDILQAAVAEASAKIAATNGKATEGNGKVPPEVVKSAKGSVKPGSGYVGQPPAAAD